MAQKTKFFRVAVEGATTDGRQIERAQIEQMARNFDPTKYGARIWLEHIRGIYPDSQFKAYGDVTALKAETIELDGKKKLALFAQIEPLPDLVAMTNKAKQKIYTSIEINPKFADSNEAYLVGLAVTDSPASLGTEVLSFAAQNPDANPFASRKKSPGNLFSEAVEADIEFDEEADDAGKFSDVLKGIKDKLKTFSRRAKTSDDFSTQVIEVVGELAEGVTSLDKQQADTDKALGDLQTKFTAFQAEHKALQEKFNTIDTTDGAKFTTRPKTSGGDPTQALTDC